MSEILECPTCGGEKLVGDRMLGCTLCKKCQGAGSVRVVKSIVEKEDEPVSKEQVQPRAEIDLINAPKRRGRPPAK